MKCLRSAFTFCRQTPVFEARTSTAALQDRRYLSFVLPSSRFPILSGRYISTDCLVNKFTFVNFELHRTFCFINWKIMENRVRNTFVLLTIVFAFSLQCILAADSNALNPSTSPASANPASVNPAHINPAHVDLSADHTENVSKSAPHVSEVPTTNNDSSTQLVNIEVYYEALCKDSVNFVSKELLPVYNKLNKFINVTFIPFAQGNITINTDKTVNVTCRRDGECAADKVHACAINKIKESEKLIKFVNCSLTEGFNSPNKTIPTEVCGKNSSIDNNTITDITECANNTDTWSTLLQNYKNMSTSANVISVPKILINKVPEDFTSINLMKVVCKKINDKDLPEDCKAIVSGSDNLVGVLPIIIGAFYIIKMI